MSNDDFDKEMRQLDEVRLFHVKYAESTTWHSGDIIAWKSITYDVQSPDGSQSVSLYVKKSMFHGAIYMHFSCVHDIEARNEYHLELEQQVNMTGHDHSEFALDIVDREKILEHLTNKHCFNGIQ